MTKNELYEIETTAHENIDRIKREQAEYIKGVEMGIELMFRAVKKFIDNESAKEIKNNG